MLIHFLIGDFALQENSPCIDAGTDFFVWEADTLVDMTPDEYVGSAPDMGAFEYEGSDECGAELGDVNGDGELNILDVTQMVNFIIEGQGSSYDECGDINDDGNLNILDVMTLVYTILNQP